MKLLLSGLLLAVMFLSGQAYGDEVVHGYSAKQSLKMRNHNEEVALTEDQPQAYSDDEIRPYGEYKDQGYLIFNDGFSFNSQPAKRGFLENLPKSIVPVVFTQNQSPEYIESIKERFGSYMTSGRERLKIMYLADRGNSFWARDNIPVPTFYHDQGKDHFMVVDAKYYYHFEPDQQVADHFNAAMWSHNYFFEGGNFVANALGSCLVVDNERVVKIPDSIFNSQYGCKELIRLPYLRGIGHADESVKFVDDNLVLTDLYEYKKILEDKGFQVVMLPKANQRYETYLNSVILEDTIYVPVFGSKKDKEALAVYRNLGFKPVPLDSKTLSNRGQGSLHCISMVYPKVEYTEMLKQVGGEAIN